METLTKGPHVHIYFCKIKRLAHWTGRLILWVQAIESIEACLQIFLDLSFLNIDIFLIVNTDCVCVGTFPEVYQTCSDSYTLSNKLLLIESSVQDLDSYGTN